MFTSWFPFFLVNSVEMCHTSNNNRDLLKNSTPKASMLSMQQSADLSKHLNLQSVEIPIESRPSTSNNDLSWQNEFSADTDGYFESRETQILLSRETDLSPLWSRNSLSMVSVLHFLCSVDGVSSLYSNWHIHLKIVVQRTWRRL